MGTPIYNLQRKVNTIARKTREWFSGATYHLMERGVRRNTIFQDDIDYKYFLKILRKCAEKNECSIHAYCLMSNHFHLLLETGNIKISDFMRDLASKYAIYYNRKYELKGHVFEGRYKSCLITTDEYFLQTSRYIHLNPVKANIVKKPSDYRWSSYNYIFKSTDDPIMKHQKTLNYFKPHKYSGYRNFVEGSLKNHQDIELKIMKAIGENEA